MKTSKDPRHLERIKVMQEVFAWDFNHQEKPHEKKAQEIVEKVAEIDKMIVAAAPMWPIEKINKIDLAILRQGVYELMMEKGNPPKVIVDEAVEIAKGYGADSSPGFINGALGKLIADHNLL